MDRRRRNPADIRALVVFKETIMLNHNGLVIVADGHGAHLYRNKAIEGVELEKIRDITPKHLSDDGPSGHRPEEQSASRLDEATFAKQLAHKLNAIVLEHKAEELVIIADPHTLGEMRGSYHGELKKRIVKEISKTLMKSSPDDIAKAILKG